LSNTTSLAEGRGSPTPLSERRESVN